MLLLRMFVIAGGVNEIDDYKGVINKIIKNLPKGHHIIFVTPYNGSKSGNEAQSLLQLRKYELEMAEKYDFVTVADWYQVAKENISIWNGYRWGFTLDLIATQLTVALNSILRQLKRL